MKTVCLLLTHEDAKCIYAYYRDKKHIENITIVAPTFEGIILAKELNIPYKTYEEVAWNINKNKLFDKAYKQAHQWHQIPQILTNTNLNAVRKYKKYPIFAMHQSFLLLSFTEILQANEFISNVIKLENPDKVVVGRRNNPFSNPDLLFILTGSNGLEREAAKNICVNRKIIFEEIDISERSVSLRPPGILSKLNNYLRNPKLVASKIISIVNPLIAKSLKAKIYFKWKYEWNPKLTGPKILIFAWGGYYFEQINNLLDHLLLNKARVAIIIIGGRVSNEEEKIVLQKGVQINYKSDLSVENEDSVIKEWNEKCLLAYTSIADNEELKLYFTGDSGNSYSTLALEAIRKELCINIPNTIIALMRSESIIHELDPDMVFNQFAYHPNETCDVLPARIKGIPTLSASHGVSLYSNAKRDSFATEFNAVVGSLYKDALMMVNRASSDKIIPTGDSRLERIKYQMETSKAKMVFGFNPDKPLCIFCDTSSWAAVTLEYRHSVFQTIEKILALKKEFPELQIVYRVHHGPEYEFMQMYFKKLEIADVTFQISPTPLFKEIVKAADLVISHHSSAITEALLSGVRVIYLYALSDVEPAYFNWEVIKVVNNFDKLAEAVKSIIQDPIDKQEVIKLAQPFFERVICGNDGNASERLANIMLQLAKKSNTERMVGWGDWLERIEASVLYESISCLEIKK